LHFSLVAKIQSDIEARFKGSATEIADAQLKYALKAPIYYGYTSQSKTEHLLPLYTCHPNDFVKDYNAYKGTAVGLTHTFRQSAFFRPRHKSKKVKNLYYSGQYTHPGIGVPMALVSSQIVAEQITSKHG